VLQGRRDLRTEEVVSVASLLQSEPTDAFARALAGNGQLAPSIRERLGEGARRLGLSPDHTTIGLDAITEACAGNSAETQFERELFERAALVAQRVAVEYRENMVVFEQAFAELDALLLQQRQRVFLQEERAAQAVHGRERLQHAREHADAVVGRRLSAQPLCEAIATFLGTSWRHHLLQVLLRDGVDSVRFADAVALGDALVEADGLAARAEGRALAGRLVSLERNIVDCLGTSGLDDSAAQHGLVALVRGLAWPDAARAVHPLPPRADIEEDSDDRKLWLAGGTDTLPPHDPSVVQALRAMTVGQWLHLVDAEGNAVKAKVGWISPLTSRRMLVNARGGRVLVASVEELATLAAQERLVMASAPRAFSEALAQVGERLRRANG
jgi:hypothetical protein